MLSVLLLLIFTWQGPSQISGQCPSLRVYATRQQIFRQGGSLPGNNRRVFFRIVNQTSNNVIIYGSMAEDVFLPNGYIIELDESTGEWIYPTPNKLPIEWTAYSNKDRYLLRPGRTFTVDAEFNQTEVGKHFRRTVYAAFKEGEKPCEITSEEVILK